MLEKKKKYIDHLLKDLGELEERVLAVKNGDPLPFSFFRESFDKIQEISRTLHLLEFLQIDDMRKQMERLVYVLSEAESREHQEAVKQEPEKRHFESSNTSESRAKENQSSEHIVQRAEKDDKQEIETTSENLGFVLPEYRDPRESDQNLSYLDTNPREVKSTVPSSSRLDNKPRMTSLNDNIPAQPLVVDLKRNISLNDRFLFQRELFQNDRQEMDRTMQALSKLSTYDQAERYLRESRAWDFENATVSDFLMVIKQGFE